MERLPDGSYRALSAGGRAVAHQFVTSTRGGHNGNTRARGRGRETTEGARERMTVPDQRSGMSFRDYTEGPRGQTHVSARETPAKPWTTGDWTVADDPHYALDPDAGDWYDDELEGRVDDSRVFKADKAAQKTKRKRKRTKKAARPHIFWQDNFADTYVDELLIHKGRGDSRHVLTCVDCQSRSIDPKGVPEYRCKDCYMDDMLCAPCCIRRHRYNPLHRIKRWSTDEKRWKRSSLKALGMRIQLGHTSMFCPLPVPAHQDFRVLHTTGDLAVDIDYCGCEKKLPHHIQLLRRGFYPGSQGVPRTAATFRLLEFHHQLSLCSKINLTDFTTTLEKMTDNTGVRIHRTRRKVFSRMSLQWRFLKLLIRGGRGHAVSGVKGTVNGELAIRCPSCPYPDINLPKDWASAPDALLFLYTVFLCIDANFRLKSQVVSSWSRDPGYGVGWAFFCERLLYEKQMESLRLKGKGNEISTCVGFDSLSRAESRGKNTRYSGIGGVSCGRGEMVVVMCNLTKGEAYGPMDHGVGVAMLPFHHLLFILLSYDIACQWFVNLFKRMSEDWPAPHRVPTAATLIPAIPKFHEPAHKQKNHQEFSLNFIHGVGMSDFETPERIWGPHNVLGTATKTNGPGARHLILDDHFQWWNYGKYISMGTTLRRRYINAIEDRNKQEEAHRGFSENILDKTLLADWEAVCERWDADRYPKTAENPFGAEETGMSESAVHEELDAFEAERVKMGGQVRHKTSAHEFLILGLDLEEEQRKIVTLAALHKTPTAHQLSTLSEQRKVLDVKLRDSRRLRAIYAPGLLQHLVELEEAVEEEEYQGERSGVRPELSKLWLPSSIPEDKRATIFMDALPHTESLLRVAQCQDALDAIRHTLRLKTRMIQYKRANVRGQRDNVRSREVIDRVHDKALFSAKKYTVARDAKLALDGPGSWENSLQVLQNADIRSYTDAVRIRRSGGRTGTNEEREGERPGDASVDDDEADESSRRLPNAAVPEEEIDMSALAGGRTREDGTGEARKELSWIWGATNIPINLDDGTDLDNKILRTEWCKSRSRVKRTTEEVALLKEEMRRTLEYLKWRSNWWLERRSLRKVDSALQEGLTAYATGQAALQLGLHEEFKALWSVPLADMHADMDELAAAVQGTDVHEEDIADAEEDEEMDSDEEDDEEGDADTQEGAAGAADPDGMLVDGPE